MVALIYSFTVIAGSTFSWFTAGDKRLNLFETGSVSVPPDGSNGLQSLPSGFLEIMRHVVEGETYALIITERPVLSGPDMNLFVHWANRQYPINDWFYGIGYETCPQVVKDAAVGAADVTTVIAPNIDLTGVSKPDPDSAPFAFASSSHESRIRWIHNLGKPYDFKYRDYWTRSMFSETQARYAQYDGNIIWGDPSRPGVGVRPALWVKVDYEPIPDSSMKVSPTLEYRFRNLSCVGLPAPGFISSEPGEMSGDLVWLAASAAGHYVEFVIPGVTPAGTYSLIASVRKTRDAGTVQASVNGENIWPAVNLYGYTQSFENVDFGSFTLNNDVTHLIIRFTVTDLSTYYGDRCYIILHSLMLAPPKII